MITDQMQTKILRENRLVEKRAVKDLNQIGKRLMWVREKLELPQRTVCEATGIPPSSYCGRECGVRAELVEEYLVLATFFNQHWIKRFKGYGPQFQGEEVKKITIEWILFGRNDVEANAQAIIEEYQMRIRQLEEEYFNKEAMLLSQIEMFALPGGDFSGSIHQDE